MQAPGVSPTGAPPSPPSPAQGCRVAHPPVTARTNLSRDEAFQLCSLRVNLHGTQTGNGKQGVHGMLRWELLL